MITLKWVVTISIGVCFLSTAHAAAGDVARQQHVATVMHFAASRARVTEAFGPLAEASWAPEFKPEFSYPSPARQIPGAVFRTANGKIWLLHDYDVAAGRVQYVISDPSQEVTLTIDVTPDGSGCTAHMNYDMVALDERGAEHFVDMENHADEMGREIHDAITTYLAGNPPDHGHF